MSEPADQRHPHVEKQQEDAPTHRLEKLCQQHKTLWEELNTFKSERDHEKAAKRQRRIVQGQQYRAKVGVSSHSRVLVSFVFLARKVQHLTLPCPLGDRSSGRNHKDPTQCSASRLDLSKTAKGDDVGGHGCDLPCGVRLSMAP